MSNEMENHGGSTVESPLNEKPKKGLMRKVLERAIRWLSHTDEKNTWMDEMRGNLSLMATVIATMTFNMALNPPGGVRTVKDDPNPSSVYIAPNNVDQYLACGDIGGGLYWDLCPGQAVLASVYYDDYFKFLVSNTICFVASLSVCLLLVSGVRFHHRLPMWMLAIGMCITLTSLAYSYITAVSMTTPDDMFDKANRFLERLIYGWMTLLAAIGLYHTLRLLVFAVKIFRKRSKSKSNSPSI